MTEISVTESCFNRSKNIANKIISIEIIQTALNMIFSLINMHVILSIKNNVTVKILQKFNF